ncbi:MAG: tRNA uridine-5-carboxymethylaminomethyl(34) synthesis GTPase MnmE [Pseudomonadota bacterium]
MDNTSETICAIATPPGRGGVGIIRISGVGLSNFATPIVGDLPKPRFAGYRKFLDQHGEVIDEGIVLYFPGPYSFTGEDVIELQGHGGPVVMDMLIERVLELGARVARPGEFSERAFLNNKLDLAQAEAIADLIDSGSRAAARLANRSLLGLFSRQIHQLVDDMIQLRLYVEAAIDFPEEEIDFLSDGIVSNRLHSIIDKTEHIQQSARIGTLLRDGMQLVIAGRPNAGKSSLLNALSGRDTAIVTEVAGTTRDLLREQIQIDGMPLHLIDTAGLRHSEDAVELEGIRRAREEIKSADMILWVYDAHEDIDQDAEAIAALPQDVPVTLICNKIDTTDGRRGAITKDASTVTVSLSAKSGEGVDLLREHLKQSMGYHGEDEGEFIARRRHLDAIKRALTFIESGRDALENQLSGELLAEDLRQAQNALGEITGEYTADDLLGEIFSSFCIGK